MSVEVINKISADYAEIQRHFYKRLSFYEYLELVKNKPEVTRSAYARIYDAIVSFGTEEVTRGKKKLVRYKVFNDPFSGGKDAVFGLIEPLMKLVNTFKAAKERYGAERRIIVLLGPVGSSKSTIARLLKRLLEHYSKTDEGALYSFEWKKDAYYGESRAKQIDDREYIRCPLNEEPLNLIPEGKREEFLSELKISDKVRIDGELCPACRLTFNFLMEKSGGDLNEVLENIRVRRLILSEKDRVGIGTFQPKDEKNQDSTELSGDVNYRMVTLVGSDSDPRAFNFDGEFEIANRGLIEFIEVLKLDVAFLYDLLGVSQEHKIKPKKFPQIYVDTVILTHTNEPEYQKIKNNEFMEAFRDRVITTDIIYETTLSEELKIYNRDYGRIAGKHLCPHTNEVAAMWTVLTRLENPKNAQLTLLQKMKLYNGKTLPGFTVDNVEQLKKEASREGHFGISPRYVQNKIPDALMAHMDSNCLNPFMVLDQLEEGLDTYPLITKDEEKKRCRELIAVVREEYTDIVKNEVQKAISADEDALQRLAANYIDHIKAYTQKEKVKNKFTGKEEEPEERLMRSVEERIDIPENRKDDFRREIMNYIGAMAIENKKFDYRQNERLAKALELKLFEDQKDTIKLASIVSRTTMNEDEQEKIEVVKSRLIREYGYCKECAADILEFVASIFARGDVKKDEKKK